MTSRRVVLEVSAEATDVAYDKMACRTSRMVITRHARERYCERIRPGADMREATLVLLEAADKAVSTGDRTRCGDLLWKVDDPLMYLVTKHDPEVGAVCVTVLHPEEMRDAVRDARLAAERRATSLATVPSTSRSLPAPASPAPWSQADVVARIRARVAELQTQHKAEETARQERWRGECETRIAQRREAQDRSLAEFDAAVARRLAKGTPSRPEQRERLQALNARALEQLRSSFSTPPLFRAFNPAAARGRAESEVRTERRRALGLPAHQRAQKDRP